MTNTEHDHKHEEPKECCGEGCEKAECCNDECMCNAECCAGCDCGPEGCGPEDCCKGEEGKECGCASEGCGAEDCCKNDETRTCGNERGHSHEGHDHGDMPHTTVKVRKPNTTGVADEGTLVTVHYKGTLDTGEIFDSSEGREPIEFVVGEHAVIKGFESGIEGMKKGDKKTITIEASDAYGDINPQLRQEVSKNALGDITPEVGMMLALQHPMAPQPIPVKIVEVGEENITIDLNHPLAGQRLHFDLELVDLK